MTVTQRRAKADPSKPDDRIVTEPGIKYTCDFCHLDITHTVRIKCAAKECEEVDICPSCFCEGKELLGHKAWHDYKVVEQHSQPIFTEDWGADEELLLISGLVTNGLGNWAEVSQHVGTRTKEECQKHYMEVFLGITPGGEQENGIGSQADETSDGIDSGEDGEVSKKGKREFMPPMNRTFQIDPDEFQNRKKARIEEMRKPHALPTNQSGPLVSAPTNHEVTGFMPGRLEFEHELFDNDAEQIIKDFEFGLVWKYGGDAQPAAAVTKPPDEDGEEDGGDGDGEPEVKKENDVEDVKVKEEPGESSGQPEASGSRSGGSSSPEKGNDRKGKGKAEPAEPEEEEGELEIKLALLDIYFSKLDRRQEAKDIVFDRGLTEYRKLQAIERKRPKDEKELVHRYKVFAKVQTAQDYEELIEGLIYEQNLRKRISGLQEYRRNGITTAAEAEAYETAKSARAGFRLLPYREREIITTGARVNAGQNRFLHGINDTPPPGDPKKSGDSRDPASRAVGQNRRPVIPLNLANSASLDLLSSEEQSLCSSLRVLPKPYLTIKELYVAENERRKGCLKRRDARRMLKIDVNKSGKIFDFLVSNGVLCLSYDPMAKSKEGQVNGEAGKYGQMGVSEVFP